MDSSCWWSRNLVNTGAGSKPNESSQPASSILSCSPEYLLWLVLVPPQWTHTSDRHTRIHNNNNISLKKKSKMKLNVCVHFIMPAIAFWKLQVAECLTFSCQAFSCWDNKCLSSFAHSGGCRLQTAGARWSLNTIPIRTPVLVAPLWLASLHARNLLLSNIYTQLERQMYHNFSDALPLHLEPLCIFVCVFWGVLGEGVCFLTKKKGGGAKL